MPRHKPRFWNPDPSEAEARTAIEACICPFCGDGPFKKLPVHVVRVHGVDKYELRDLAGLMRYDPISSPEHIEGARQRAIDQGRGYATFGSSAGASRRISKAGMERMRVKGQELQRIVREDPKWRAANQAAWTEERRKQMSVRLTGRNSERDAAIVQRVLTSTDPVEQIASEFGVHRNTVGNALRRADVKIGRYTRPTTTG